MNNAVSVRPERARENLFDLLRILCCIAVVAIHLNVSVADVDASTRQGLLSAIPAYLFNCMTRFAVPCFLLLTGGFVLADKRNRDWKFFYQKAVRNVFLPTVGFSIFYVLYRIVKLGVHIIQGTETVSGIVTILSDLICGSPFYHMWYLYTLIGIYLLIPFLIRFCDTVGEKPFAVISFVFLFLASISEWTSRHVVFWDLGKAFCFCGYVMAGYVVKKHFDKRKSNRKGLLFLLAAVAVLVATSMAVMISETGLAGLPLGEYSYISVMSPFIVAASLLMFAAFSCFEIKTSFVFLSSLTFAVYLIHAAVVDLTKMALSRFFGIERLNILVSAAAVVFVFAVSSVFAWLYLKLRKKADGKLRIGDKVCRLLKLL